MDYLVLPVVAVVIVLIYFLHKIPEARCIGQAHSGTSFGAFNRQLFNACGKEAE